MIPSAGCLVFSCLVSNLCLHSSCYYITKFSIQFHTFITLHNTHHIHSFYTTQHDFALCASTLLCFISTSLFTSLHFILFYFIVRIRYLPFVWYWRIAVKFLCNSNFWCFYSLASRTSSRYVIEKFLQLFSTQLYSAHIHFSVTTVCLSACCLISLSISLSPSLSLCLSLFLSLSLSPSPSPSLCTSLPRLPPTHLFLRRLSLETSFDYMLISIIFQLLRLW